MKNVILTTLFSGYNYGSSLQTYASKIIIEELGYSCKLVARKTIVKGRDIRLEKLFTIIFRTLLTFDYKVIKSYKNSYQKELYGNSADRFASFESEYLNPSRLTWKALCKAAKRSIACIAGSDQLWNPTTLYVDPLYYLRFAPSGKKISFSTSLGHEFVADYNKKKIKKWISDIDHLSVREDSGVKLIKELCGKEPLHLLDPSLLIDGDTWRSKLGIKKRNTNYILAYFLDVPSQQARECIDLLVKKFRYDVIAIPYKHSDMSYATRMEATGPLDFLDLVENAKIVVTDSFHGTAFSINLHTPFFVFDRNYGSAHSQSSRVMSLLNKLGLIDRYEPNETKTVNYEMSFLESEHILRGDRKIARDYLKTAIESCHLSAN